jgi:hypothetical protein
MLRSTKELKDYVLHARDGEIGRCRDFLFDDEDWVVRYMVADTGRWIPDKEVLLSPMALGEPEWEAKKLPVDLTRPQIREAPSVAANEPVSRQMEAAIHEHYGFPYYWGGADLWGVMARPDLLRDAAPTEEEGPIKPMGDPHLRSVREVTGYRIQARDGEIGHIEDFVLDDETWALRYMVVDTRNWLPGRKVLVAPVWVEDLDWPNAKAAVGLTRAEIEGAPPFRAGMPVSREYEARLYDHYGRSVYWRKR